MIDLVKRLFKEEKSTVTFNEGIRFVQAHYPNFDSRAFPQSETQTSIPTERHYCWFSRLKSKLVSGEYPPSVAISGAYHTQAKISDVTRGTPGSVNNYRFTIAGNKLSI